MRSDNLFRESISDEFTDFRYSLTYSGFIAASAKN